MGRPPLDPSEKKILFNCYLSKEEHAKLKTICYRRSVQKKKKFAEASFVKEAIHKTRLPKPPTPEAVAEYEASRLRE